MNNKEYISFTKTKLPYGWMGNMYPCKLVHNDLEWKSTEAIFQSLRFNDEDIIESIRLSKNGFDAKQVAIQNIDKMFIERLSKQDIDNMRYCVGLKLDQNKDFKSLLLNTENLPIYEDVTKRGDVGSNLFWGAMLVNGNWVGENILGEIWMEFRRNLSEEKKTFIQKNSIF